MTLDEMEAVAKAAQEKAPGPYQIEWTTPLFSSPPDDERGVDFILDAKGEQVVIGDSGCYPPSGPAATHIATFSPDVVLGLIARVRELEALAALSVEYEQADAGETSDVCQAAYLKWREAVRRFHGLYR